MSSHFVLDSNIRFWVFLPIVLLTFFIEVMRHYTMLVLNNKARSTLDEIQSLEMKKRVSVLLKNHMYIPKSAFEMRKSAFHPDSAFLNPNRGPVPQKRVLQPFSLHNQEKLFNTLKIQTINHLPMVLAGAWVSYTFSGFICTKVPFPLTISFKSMLQRNIDLPYMDPSWVSSCSWYFLNVFGLRNFLNMFFEEPEESEPSDMDSFGEGGNIYFREDFNNLQIIVHENRLHAF